MNLLFVAGAFFLGSIPFAPLISRLFGRTDIQTAGSGNPGASNVFRLAGPLAGILVFLLDVGKGYLPVYLAGPLGAPWPEFCGLAAALGHIYSPFLRFRGGKGVATFLGTFLALFPTGVAVVFPLALLSVVVTRIFSVGSLTGATLLPVVFYLLHPRPLETPQSYTFLYMFIALILILLRHRENLARMKRGTEHTIR
ncbi:MAG: glycerol-3-phosphate 1-O-acyltransferase PlsY [Spirochaetales bacterium]|nr:glycerol-3-phosphate 1-O-acyltransferase PlsY [Spirochaetales bacterium]